MERIADPKPHIERVHKVLGELKQAFPSVEKWGSVGCKCRYYICLYGWS